METNNIKFEPVITSNQIEDVVQVAHAIWTEHYIPIIGNEQVKYMLEKFQSAEAIALQIDQGYCYYLVRSPCIIGYFAFELRNRILFISKIYLKNRYRKLGIGTQMFHFIKDYAIRMQATSLSLTVNKNNTKAIKAYQNLGFVKTTELVIDIGQNFVMDDYEMTFTLH